ncbi:hypothetical protein HK102_014119 [Quaeritorhiza haematococci]|nr:hypothetical protein HK102_014119 [Quaeritorhiza haematococci]
MENVMDLKSSDYAFNTEARNLWVAVFVLFVLWWIYQVALYGEKIRSRQPAVELRDEGEQHRLWAEKLAHASNVARDSVLLLLAGTVLATAVGATNVMVILGWIFLVLSVVWQISLIATVSPAVHILFLLISVPFIIGLMVVAYNHG